MLYSLSGAGNIQHMEQVYAEGYTTRVEAGSLFVYHGARNGILINYPEKAEIETITR